MKTDDRKQATDRNGVTRRTFVQVGAAGLAIAAAPRMIARPGAAGAIGKRHEPYQYRGAMFCTRYSADGRGWEGVRSSPALGQYSSSDVGAIDTHITLAKQYGLSFFLAESATDDRRDYRTRNLAQLFERTDMHELATAVMLSGFGSRNGVPPAVAADAWLGLRLQNLVSSGVLDHASYLRDEKGRAIVAVNAGSAGRELAGAAQRLLGGTDVHDSMWLWVIGDDASRPAELGPGIAWVAQPQAPRLRDALARRGEVALLSMSAETQGANISAECLSAYSRSRYIVIDSFNDWKTRTAMEPMARDRSRSVFVTTLGKQLDAVVR